MKVALELQPCCGKRSGVGTYVYELARKLHRQDGLEFVGNLFNYRGRNDNSEALEGITIPIRENRVFPFGIYQRIWKVLPLPYEMMFPPADLNLFFNYIVPPRVGGKVITTIHDLTFLRYPETVEKENYQRLKQGLADSVDRSDHILTVSEFSKREIIELLGVPEKKISVVYNAPSVSEEQVEWGYVHERFGITLPYLLYVGTIEPRKNLVRLLHAYEQLKDEMGIPHQLVLAGGNGWNNEEIFQTAQGSKYRESILFTGYVSVAEKNTLYAHAAAFVFPSIYEGFGIPPLEAMHFGCPVVCADAASLPEVVGAAAQFVDPINEASIVEGIWRVISDSAYREGLIQRGKRQVQRFSWDTSARGLAQICKKVLEEDVWYTRR